ncbi:MAG: GNAT family N-acetyltransferase [Beijerinckiaceae bacterium]|jgi:GNAT superfamily N-acetyltransferase|nr:GNAT family N-acetyltransferase [Beijerinckiaceae bacterium]
MNALPPLLVRAATLAEILPVRVAGLHPGEPIDIVRIANDAEGSHWAIEAEGMVVSVASLFTEGERVQLRKFATLPAWQGRGIGTWLLAALIEEARRRGGRIFWCNARVNALAIYLRAGLEPEGERYEKDGRLYQRMSRTL